MCLRVPVNPETGQSYLIPFRGLCGKSLYLPPEYLKLQLNQSKRESVDVNSGRSEELNIRIRNDVPFSGTNTINIDENSPRNNTNRSVNSNENNLSNMTGDNRGGAVGGVDGFAADVWMSGVVLLFLLTGIKIQDLTLVNLFLNKTARDTQPHKWIGSIPIPMVVPVYDVPNDTVDTQNSSYLNHMKNSGDMNGNNNDNINAQNDRNIGECKGSDCHSSSTTPCTSSSSSTSSSFSSSSSSSYTSSSSSSSSSSSFPPSSFPSSSTSFPTTSHFNSHTSSTTPPPIRYIIQQTPLRIAYPDAYALLSSMLNTDPTARISLADVRNHAWLRESQS